MDRKDRKQQRHFDLQERILQNFISRERYWDPIIAKELSILPGIAWFIQAELIRTGQLPEGTTISDINNVHHALRDCIAEKAVDVFNAIYRPRTKERFTVLDNQNRQLVQRIGSVHSYERGRQSYLCYLDTSKGSGPAYGQACYLKPRFLEPLYPNRLRKDHKKPQEHTIIFHNPLPTATEQQLSAIFKKQVFENVTRLWKHPEEMGQASYDFLVCSMNQIDSFEEGRQAALDNTESEFRKRMDRLIDRASSDRVAKHRSRSYRNMPSESAAQQLKAAQSVERERLAAKMKQANLGNCHMFTMPFATTDESIYDAGHGLNEFDHEYNTHPDDDRRHAEFKILTSMGTKPVVINGNSVDLLKPPGEHLDNNVVDLCLKW